MSESTIEKPAESNVAHEGEPEMLHQCDKCNKTFRHLVQLNFHTCEQEKVYSCDLCGNYVFDSVEALKEHLKLHASRLFNDQPTIELNVAKQPTKGALLTSDPSENQCDLCGKNFKLKSSMKRHKLLHTAEKNHSCETCGKLFATNQSLIRHVKVHTREAQHFKCEECGRNFVKKHFFMAHVLTHKNPKPTKTHDCTDCGKSFAQKISLTKHIKTHTK